MLKVTDFASLVYNLFPAQSKLYPVTLRPRPLDQVWLSHPRNIFGDLRNLDAGLFLSRLFPYLLLPQIVQSAAFISSLYPLSQSQSLLLGLYVFLNDYSLRPNPRDEGVSIHPDKI